MTLDRQTRSQTRRLSVRGNVRTIRKSQSPYSLTRIVVEGENDARPQTWHQNYRLSVRGNVRTIRKSQSPYSLTRIVVEGKNDARSPNWQQNPSSVRTRKRTD